jgi:hypothetical protein
MTQKAQAIKGKIDKLNIIKIKNFCASKSTSKKMKIQPKEWKKMFASHIFEKELVNKELLQA